MNDTQDKAPVPSQSDPPRGATRRALMHVLAFLKVFFIGSWGLTKEYAPKAQEGLKRLLLVKPRSLVMLFRARGELVKARSDAGAKDKAAEGELEIRKAQAREIVLKTEAEVRHRDAETELLRMQTERERKGIELQELFLDEILSGRIPFDVSVTCRDGTFEAHIESPSTKPKLPKRVGLGANGSTSVAPQLPKPSEPPAHGTNGDALETNKLAQPEA